MPDRRRFRTGRRGDHPPHAAVLLSFGFVGSGSWFRWLGFPDGTFPFSRRFLVLFFRRLAFADPDRVSYDQTEGFFRGLDLQGVGVRVHAFRELDPEAFESFADEPLGKLVGGGFPRLVAVVGDKDPLDSGLLEGFEVVGGEAVHAVGSGDIAEARAPEGKRVDDRFAQNHIGGCGKGGRVENPFVRAGKVEVMHQAGGEVRADFPAVDFGNVAVFIEDGKDDSAVAVLVSGCAIDSKAGEPLADRRARLPASRGKPQAEGAVRVADLEMVDHFGISDSPLFEVGQRFRAFLQRLVVVIDDLAHQFVVFLVEGNRRWEPAPGMVSLQGFDRIGRDGTLPQDLDGVPEADALRLHHPINHASTGTAGPEAVPEVLFRGDDQAGIFIVVKNAKADEVLPVGFQDDAPRFREALDGDFPLQSLDFFLWNTGHRGTS